MTASMQSSSRRPARDTWTALADQGLYSATSFATTMLIARNASVEDLGWFSAGISLLITAVGFMGSLVAIPLMLSIQGSTPRDRANELTGGLGASAALAGIMAGGMLLAIPVLTLWHGRPPQLDTWLLVMAAVVIPMVVREFARQMAFAQHGLPGLGLMDLAYSAAALGGLGMLAHSGHLNANRGLAVVGGAALISVLIWGIATRPSFRLTAIAATPGFLRTHLRTSQWLIGASVLYACSISAVPWLLGLLATSTSVGIFAASAVIAGVLNPLLMVGSNLTAPRTARAAVSNEKRAVRQVAVTASAILGSALAVVGIGLGLGQTILMPLMLGRHIHTMPSVLWLLVASVVCEALGLGAFWGLHSTGQSRLAFWARAAAVVVALPVGALGILRFGVLGAAGLMLGLRALNAAFNWILFLGWARPREALTAKLAGATPADERSLVPLGADGAQ